MPFMILQDLRQFQAEFNTLKPLTPSGFIFDMLCGKVLLSFFEALKEPAGNR